MNRGPNTPILAYDPAGDQATMLAAKRGGERTFGILCRRQWLKMFAVALRYTRAPREAILAAILLLPLLVLVAQQTSPLIIDGPQGQARVIQVQGKNYVEVDEVARITGGSLHFAGSQIILTLPAMGDASSQAVQSAQPAGFSRQFVSAGIETMREILEWHAALKTAIERGYPLSDEWLGNFRRQIQGSLKHAEAAASTDMDQKALPLLVNEFNNMGALNDRYLKITVSRIYLAPDSLSSDPLEQKLLMCWQSLASMASSNQFVDDGSCQ
jgi:hypothetical protein